MISVFFLSSGNLAESVQGVNCLDQVTDFENRS